MSAPKRRKRGDVLPTEVMAQPAQDSFAELLQESSDGRVTLVDDAPQATPAVRAKLPRASADKLEALLEESRRLEREELGAMLDQRFATLRAEINEKLEAICTRLSSEVEKLSMRAVEVGDVADPAPPEPTAVPTRSQLWWEHVGHVWPSPEEELSLESIEWSVSASARRLGLVPGVLFEKVLKLYAADPSVSMQPSGRTAIDLQVRLHEYLSRALPFNKVSP
jgi:hypothetical protein